MDEIEEILTHEPAEYRWTCGSLSGGNIEPQEASLVEAVMLLGLVMCDEHGKVLHFRIPPSLALATVRFLRCKRPMEEIQNFVRDEQRRIHRVRPN